MANEPDEVSTADDKEIAALDTALGTPPEVKDGDAPKSVEAKDAPLEDAHPGDTDNDEVEPNLPNTLSAEEKRERNRLWRQQQKTRRKEKEEQVAREVENLRSQNSELNNRLATIEQRSTGTDLAALDARIKKAGEAYVWYKGQVAEQMRGNSPEGVAEATDKMLQSQREHDHFLNLKTGYQQAQRTGARPAPDPRLAALASKWMADNSWYNPRSGDEDSIRVLAEDRILISKGFDPATPAYWDELSKSVAKVLPHRAKPGYNPPNNGARPPVAGGGGNGGGGTVPKGSFQLSAARVTAMKDAGMWDDPTKRAAQIAQYKKYDAEHANQ